MKSKIYFFMALLAAASVIVSCSKDDDDEASYTFLDQEMQGKIEGDNWSLTVGTAEVSVWDSTLLDLSFHVDSSDDPCNDWQLQGNKIIGTVPNAVGLYPFNFDFSGDDNMTITLFHSETSMNIIATEGAIEITLIDIANGVVEGRVATTVDDDNFVNGNFSIIYCPE